MNRQRSTQGQGFANQEARSRLSHELPVNTFAETTRQARSASARAPDAATGVSHFRQVSRAQAGTCSYLGAYVALVGTIGQLSNPSLLGGFLQQPAPPPSAGGGWELFPEAAPPICRNQEAIPSACGERRRRGDGRVARLQGTDTRGSVKTERDKTENDTLA